MAVRRVRMKQRDLIKKLESAGFQFKEHGHDHKYVRGSDTEEVPRHREVNERLARHIIKKWGL